MSRILLGVSGGIAAYKALEFVRLATGAGHALRVVQTPASLRFVGEASFAALSGAPVLVDEYAHDPARGAFPDQQPPPHEPISHLELVRNADLFLIAPASANTIAKLAHGLADNLLCNCVLAADCPLVLAPAMNNHMYEHPATQANLATLRERGVLVIEPDSGRLASKGEEGVGRLAEPVRLLAECEALLAGEWKGLHLLITTGGTREPIDSVRFIGNSSSGRMGLALAQAARTRGAQVTVIAANVSLPAPAGVARRDVTTALQMQQACEEEFPNCNVLLMAAAIADFRPVAGQQRQDQEGLARAPAVGVGGDRGRAVRDWRPSAATDRSSSASLPSTARGPSSTGAASSRRSVLMPWSSTTSRAATSALTPTPTRSRSSQPAVSTTSRARPRLPSRSPFSMP